MVEIDIWNVGIFSVCLYLGLWSSSPIHLSSNSLLDCRWEASVLWINVSKQNFGELVPPHASLRRLTSVPHWSTAFPASLGEAASQAAASRAPTATSRQLATSRATLLDWRLVAAKEGAGLDLVVARVTSRGLNNRTFHSSFNKLNNKYIMTMWSQTSPRGFIETGCAWSSSTLGSNVNLKGRTYTKSRWAELKVNFGMFEAYYANTHICRFYCQGIVCC